MKMEDGVRWGGGVTKADELVDWLISRVAGSAWILAMYYQFEVYSCEVI